MNNMIQYLSALPEINHLVVFGGKMFEEPMISEILKEITVDSIFFYLNDQSLVRACKAAVEEESNQSGRIASIECKVQYYAEARKLDRLQPRTAILFDKLDDSDDILDWVRLKPYCLCGAVPLYSVGTFEIWEKYRACTEKFYLVSPGKWNVDEVLCWEKRPGESIELSVIYPMYNVAEYLPQCIETTTAWKADYIEFLFVDDGSPDNSADIVREAAKKDPRIKLLQKENGGCASARQYGLDRAKGRYVGFIDPDDYTDTTMFHKLLRRAMTGGYEIAYCGYSEVYTEVGGMSQVPDLLGEPYCYGTVLHDKIQDLCAFLRVAIWRGIYSTEMIRKTGVHFYTDLRRFDDLPFKFQVFSIAKSVVAVPEHLYFYRMGRPGQDVASNDQRLFVHFDIFKYLDEFVSKRGTNELVELLQVVKIATHKYALSKILPEYADEYVEGAKKDLLSLYSPREAKIVLKRFMSKRDMLFYHSVIHGNSKLAKKLSE